MECHPCWFVQSTEDGEFLAPDGEGGVVTVQMLANAVGFDTREAAIHASVDHLEGQASVTQFFLPVGI